MTEWIAIGLSLVALLVSLYVLWRNELRVGLPMLVRPTQIYVGGKQPTAGQPQVLFISMLAWTSKRGGCLENLAAIVHQDDATWDFPIWVTRQDSGRMHRGHPMHLSQQGSRAEMHFVRAKDTPLVRFKTGSIRIEILCSTKNRNVNLLNFESSLNVDQADLLNRGGGVFFDLILTTGKYVASVDREGANLRIEIEDNPFSMAIIQ